MECLDGGCQQAMNYFKCIHIEVKLVGGIIQVDMLLIIGVLHQVMIIIIIVFILGVELYITMTLGVMFVQ